MTVVGHDMRPTPWATPAALTEHVESCAARAAQLEAEAQRSPDATDLLLRPALPTREVRDLGAWTLTERYLHDAAARRRAAGVLHAICAAGAAHSRDGAPSFPPDFDAWSRLVGMAFVLDAVIEARVRERRRGR